MKLTEMTLTQFSDVLASDAPAPGGGSAAALQGAQGAALIAMVARLTVGKAKYAGHEALMRSIIQQADELRGKLLDIIDEDTEAFNAVSAVFAMPRENSEEKAARKQAMQGALKGCTLTPWAMMKHAEAALALAEKMPGKCNESAASDLGVAVACLRACLQGAWMNVLINVGGIEDEVFCAHHQTDGQALMDLCLPLADALHVQILEML